MVTSNRVRLLAFDNRGRNVIPDSIKLVAGRTGQEYKVRKNRKGAFWEDWLSCNGSGKKPLFKAMYHSVWGDEKSDKSAPFISSSISRKIAFYFHLPSGIQTNGPTRVPVG